MHRAAAGPAVTVVLLALIGGCGGTTVDPGARRDDASGATLDRARAASVLVRARGCDFAASGSGFLADSTHVVTNRHVVDGAVSVQVRTSGGERSPVRRWFVSRTSDLALLELADPVRAEPLKVDPAPLGVGDPVAVVGYPDGGPLTVGRGEVSALVDPRTLDDQEPASAGDPLGGSLVADVTVVPGSSGGPWVDPAGNVRAVTVATDVEDGSAIGIAGERVARLYAGDNVGVLPARC